MTSKHAVIGWVLMLAMQISGCYTSSLIDPGQRDAPDATRKLYRNRIQFVQMKDGTEYRFDKPPYLFADAIVGEAKIRVPEGVMTQQVTIPLRGVAVVGVKEMDWTATAVVVTVLGIVTGALIIALSVDAAVQ